MHDWGQEAHIDEYTNLNLSSLSIFIKYRWTDEKNFHMNFHSHHGYELFFLHGGNGKYVNEGHIYSFEGNDLILIPAHDIHKAAPAMNQPYTRTVINFLPQCLNPGAQMKLLDMFSRSYDPEQRHLRLSPERHAHIYELLERMNDEYKRKQAGYEQVLNIYLYRLLEEVYRIFFLGNDDRKQLPDSGNSIVESVMKYLSAHYTQNLSLNELSKAFFITPYYLCRLFKKTTGETISEFILYTRIRQAKHELIFSDISITEIAENVGFNNYSYFGAVFKKHEKLTPKQYRKKYK